METNEQGPSMNRRIFELGLPTETISLYLLCCGIKDAGMTISTKNILERWNGSKQDFSTCARDLENRNIVERILSDGDGHEVFRLKDVHGWR